VPEHGQAAGFCERSLPENSIYRFLARERDRLFPDELFVDLFTDRGRRSVPPSVVATVMVLQRLDGLLDREAVDRYAFDVRWRYAAGVGGYGGGWGSFAHLARSAATAVALTSGSSRVTARPPPRRTGTPAPPAASPSRRATRRPPR
jgi:hypothetical protein